MKRLIIGSLTHAVAVGIGFALGIYFLPILTAPPSPDASTLEEMAQDAAYRADIAEDLPGNDFVHWGKGTLSLTQTHIVHEGELAPGPDYMVYLVPDFVEDETGFEQLKAASQLVGPVKTFNGFVLDMPNGIDLEAYTTVLIWCEAFSEFIAAAKYR